MSLQRLEEYAALITRELRKHFPQEHEQARQVIALAEETGEFTGAARRYMKWARRNGNKEEMEFELADVVITAFVTAQVFDIDLPTAINSKIGIILTRGWKDDDSQEVL